MHSDHACRHCEGFGTFLADGVHVWCVRGSASYAQAQPAQGCVHWRRQPGSDDEAVPPALVQWLGQARHLHGPGKGSFEDLHRVGRHPLLG